MEIRHLRYFLDIAETEHLTRSAQRLFVTQSTLSHGLRQLEAELGLALFDRVGRGLRLSAAGRSFRDHALRSLHELDAGRMALSDLTGLRTGRLTIGVFPTFLNTLMPATVAAFRTDYPGIRVEVRDLRGGPIHDQVLDGTLDFGVAIHPTTRDGIETEHLFDERLLVVVRAGHRWARRRSIRVADLEQCPLALLPRSFATRWMIDEHLAELGLRPEVPVEIESVEALLGVCRNSDLASIVPERAVTGAPGLVALSLVQPVIVRKAGLLWRRGASRSAAAEAFAARLRDDHAPADDGRRTG